MIVPALALLLEENQMPAFTAYAIRIGDGYLGRKHSYSSDRPKPFDKARIFFRRSDAKQAIVPKDYRQNSKIVRIEIFHAEIDG